MVCYVLLTKNPPKEAKYMQGVIALWSVYDVCHDMFGSLKMISFIIDAELNQEDWVNSNAV